MPDARLDGSGQARNAPRHQLVDVEPLLEHDTRHQHRNRDVRAALDAFDAFGLAVAALETRQRPVVLPNFSAISTTFPRSLFTK